MLPANQGKNLIYMHSFMLKIMSSNFFFLITYKRLFSLYKVYVERGKDI